MTFNITHTAKPRTTRVGLITPVNTTTDGCAATITTRYEAIGYGNIYTLAHFPMSVCLLEYEL